MRAYLIPCSLGGAWAFGLVRVLQGVCEGVTFPSLHALTARWVPPEERASFVARSYFGSTFGLIVTFPLCGYVAQEVGWEAGTDFGPLFPLKKTIISNFQILKPFIWSEP